MLRQQIEDQMDEIQGLLDESEGRRLSGVHKDLKNTELTNQIRQLKEELGAKATRPAATTTAGADFPWSSASQTTTPTTGDQEKGKTASGGSSTAGGNSSAAPPPAPWSPPPPPAPCSQGFAYSTAGGDPSATNQGFTDGRVKEADKCELEEWPSAGKFRLWRMSQKKIIASASGRPEACFIWIGKCETASTMEELEDSEDFPSWDAKLGVGSTKICRREFLRRLQVYEERAALMNPPRMIKGRQIFWLILQRFKLSDIDSSLQEWKALAKVELKGDNLVAFMNDWDYVLAGIDEMPTEKYLEHLFFQQLSKSKQLEQPIALYKQAIAHEGAPRSYQRLLTMVAIHIEERQMAKMRDQVDNNGQRAHAAKGKGKTGSGVCRQWQKHGTCSREDCPWKSSHTDEVHRRGRPRDKSQGSGGRGKDKKDKKNDRGRSPGSDNKSRSNSPMTNPKTFRGKSPSGKKDVEACRN